MNDLKKQREQVLCIRRQLLNEKAEALQGNRRSRKKYVQELERVKPELTPFQKEYLVGLVLGDATVKGEPRIGTARFSIQQSLVHEPWLLHIKDIFREYMANDKETTSPENTGQSGGNQVRRMGEVQSLKCSTFYKFLMDMFYPEAKLEPNKETHKKRVTELVSSYITPVSVAAWFCGDGSPTSDPEKHKGITFHAQGFTKEENELLARLLCENIGLEAYVKQDSHTQRQSEKTVIIISGESYDHFVNSVGPYIHSVFFSRVPTGRKVNSAVEPEKVTVEKRDKLLGSKLEDLEELIVSYP